MSYNIDTWKTKKLENLEIPIKEFFTHVRKDFHPEITKGWEQHTLDCMEFVPTNIEEQIVLEAGEDEIIGIEKDGILKVLSINLVGCFSGVFYEQIFKPALLKSTGKLEAVTVWEGGDSILKLFVKDGKVKESPVDL